MQAKVDEEVCTGCELCAQTCPEVFEMNEDKAVAKPGDVPEDLAETCRQAAEECPVEAISIID